MTHSDTSLSLANLRMRIESGTLPSPGTASILASLDLAQTAIGSEAFQDPDLLKTERSFSTVLPHEPDDELVEAFGDAALYRRCRDSILRHVKLAGALHDGDPYTLLNQLARENRIAGVNRRLMEAMFPGVALRDITRQMALTADRDLRRTERNSFRNSLSTIDKLRDDPRVVTAGILGPNKFGSMPTYRDGDRQPLGLPPEFNGVLDEMPVSQARRARRAFELAVDFGVFGVDGPRPGWSMSLECATRYRAAVKQKVSEYSADNYLLALLSLLRKTIPGAVPDNVTADRVRRPERQEAPAKPRKRRTERRPVVLPGAIEAEVSAFANERSTDRRRVRNLRRFLRDVLEAGFDIESPTFLADAVAFLETASQKRTPLTLLGYRTVLRAFLAHTDRLSLWDGLISRANGTIASGNNMQGLLLIRKFAERAKPPIPPAKIDVNVAREFLKIAAGTRDLPKCLAGLAALDVLRTEFPERLPSTIIGDQRAWLRAQSGGPPTALENALQSVAVAAVYGDFGVKELIVAARRLYELTPDKTVFDAPVDIIRWHDLIAAAHASHPREMLHYRLALLRLADHVGRNWTPGWQELQRHIVDAGIPRADNPVDALMGVAVVAGLEPWQLDKEWAWMHERSLRPDLRITWSRNIDRLDALHAVPEVAATGLLPTDRLGPMPARGSRLKQAVYPLPARFQAVLEGETKQVLEAAHFLWRCLRAFGVYARGDDPAPFAIVTDEHLERIMSEQPFMTPASARFHVARIRDWRESRPGLV